ncbi:hypothetical protein FZO89_09800 [Luteimonas viscosa]|uniref:Uncharacterized protein n=1 Tax=Luteimonas viscosa TaxID=1132694 RepID=A0A5D4XPL9_9GAMM|nr:hypothetical protein [Luteimonas viscosa]TYT26529.1 hypothetical protein FZO89_09800 [Luteimonas viscosa]
MNIYAGLLFNQGHISDPGLARSLARTPPVPSADAPPPGARTGPTAPGSARPRLQLRRRWTELQASLLWPLR